MRTNTEQGLSWGLAERLLGVCCEICHHRERERENIEIHHLDGNRKNNRRWNLVWIHKTCHISLTKANGQYGSWKSKNQETDASSIGANACGRENVESYPPHHHTLPLSPEPTWTGERSDEAKRGLLKYLPQAIRRHETRRQILANAGAWINPQDPISEPCIRRWLKMYTESRYFPYRFDDDDKIYLDEAEYPTKEGKEA